jgi:hypothetical protein
MARGVVFWDGPLSPDQHPEVVEKFADPDIYGNATIWPNESGIRMSVAVKPDLTPDRREGLAQWVEEKLDRFTEAGPEPDGWVPVSDGGWQLWVRAVQMPSLD